MSRIEADTEGGLERTSKLARKPPEAVFQALDLSPYETAFLDFALTGRQFFGRSSPSTLVVAAQAAQCLVYRANDELPFRQIRERLYSPEESLDGFDPAVPSTYHGAPDWQVNLTFADPAAWLSPTACLDENLARRIHDNSISDARHEIVEPIKLKRHLHIP